MGLGGRGDLIGADIEAGTGVLVLRPGRRGFDASVDVLYRPTGWLTVASVQLVNVE